MKSVVVSSMFRNSHLSAGALLLLFFVLLCFPALANDRQDLGRDAQTRLIKLAEKAMRKGEHEQCESILRGLLSQNPNNIRARLVLSRSLLKQRRLAEAYDYSYEVAKSEPKNSYAVSLVANALLSAGNFRKARPLLLSAYNLDNGNALAIYGLGMLDFFENRLDDSYEKLSVASFLESDEPDYVLSLAQAAAKAEKYKQASEFYKRFLHIAPIKDQDRRSRIKGLIDFLGYLGNRGNLYQLDGKDRTTIPIEIINERPMMRVKINRNSEELRFVLDTGSGMAVISERTAEKLKIKPVARGGTAAAVGGDGKFEIVFGFINTLALGDVRVRNLPVYIRKFHHEMGDIDGYIGLSMISKFLTTVDYGNSTFSLVRRNSVSSPERIVAASGGFTMPLRITPSGFLSSEVSIEGLDFPVNFIVDTGATITVISKELASLDQLKKHIQRTKMRVIGAAGITEDVPSFNIPQLSLGSLSRDDVSAIALDLRVINETAGFEQAGILGGNFLRRYRMTFDFENAQVSFSPLNAADERSDGKLVTPVMTPK
jgi:predicted aspartyl protease/cytochrome c-type biogenesis protein CcmH/NrfG